MPPSKINAVNSEIDQLRAALQSVWAMKCDKLRTDNERLRTALLEIVDLLSDGPGGPRRLTAMEVARLALEQSGDSK